MSWEQREGRYRDGKNGLGRLKKGRNHSRQELIGGEKNRLEKKVQEDLISVEDEVIQGAWSGEGVS